MRRITYPRQKTQLLLIQFLTTLLGSRRLKIIPCFPCYSFRARYTNKARNPKTTMFSLEPLSNGGSSHKLTSQNPSQRTKASLSRLPFFGQPNTTITLLPHYYHIPTNHQPPCTSPPPPSFSFSSTSSTSSP